MNRDRELEELRQFRYDAIFFEIDLTGSVSEIKDERERIANKAAQTDDPYLIGVFAGIDFCLKRLASPIDFGERWIRQPEPKKPHLTLVVDNTAIKNRLSASDDQTA